MDLGRYDQTPTDLVRCRFLSCLNLQKGGANVNVQGKWRTIRLRVSVGRFHIDDLRLFVLQCCFIALISLYVQLIHKNFT